MLKNKLEKKSVQIWSIFSKVVDSRSSLTVQFEDLKLNDVFRPFQSVFR